MSYDCHIEREASGRGMTLEEWCDAVFATLGVRLANVDPHTITNPVTGEVIGIPMHEGDAEVFFSNENVWRPVFRWCGGSAVFAERGELADGSHPVWPAVVALAGRLGAVIRGEAGEVYDFKTG